MNSYMSKKTMENINLDKILDMIQPVTEYGKKLKLNMNVFTKGQEKELNHEFDKLQAFLNLSNRSDIILLLKHIKNITTTLNRVEDKQVLGEAELFEIKNFIIFTEKIKTSLASIDIEELQLFSLLELLELLDPNNEKLNTFYLYDQYSEKLASIRAKKKNIQLDINHQRKYLREELENAYEININHQDEAKIRRNFQETIEVLKQEKRLTLYRESYLDVIFKLQKSEEWLALDKEMEELSFEEEKEELNIRSILSSKIKDYYNQLIANTHIVGEIDFLIAKAEFAKTNNLNRPQISDKLYFNIQNGRNLYLEQTLINKNKHCTPISVELKKNVICITGANMGGKTVSLKMIAQIVAMSNLGIYVPATSSTICLFEHVYAIVGDDQNIEKGLSSYGSQIMNIKEAIDNSDHRCFILIDELAGGTNAAEGYAITKAIIKFLEERTCATIITTHYENVCSDNTYRLQVKGLDLPNDLELINTANFEEISKYMDYSLVEVDNEQVPRDAIRIAKMIGIDDEIINTAQEYLR